MDIVRGKKGSEGARRAPQEAMQARPCSCFASRPSDEGKSFLRCRGTSPDNRRWP